MLLEDKCAITHFFDSTPVMAVNMGKFGPQSFGCIVFVISICKYLNESLFSHTPKTVVRQIEHFFKTLARQMFLS